MKPAIILLLSLSFISCATVPTGLRVPTDAKTVVDVPETYSFRFQNTTMTLPSGIYEPLLDSDIGLFYKPPAPLTWVHWLYGTSHPEGGLLFKRGTSDRPYFWIKFPLDDPQGKIYVQDEMSKDFKYSLRSR
jgi:hypothetical protein